MRISDWSSDVCSSDLIAEGIETAISAMILLGLPVWAALGNERIPRIATPDSVSRLILLPDNDRAGRPAVPLATKPQAGSGRRIETICPWNDRNDWNADIRHGGEGARDWRSPPDCMVGPPPPGGQGERRGG